MRTNAETQELLFQTKFIYESNLIENIDTPFNEIWIEWTKNPPKGHVGALAHANSNAFHKKHLTELMICTWQDLIIREQNSVTTNTSKILLEIEIGRYRTGKVWVGGRLCIPPQAVPICMKQLVEEVNNFQKNPPNSNEDIIQGIADFHFEFLWIHPFADGNGRTSRILAWYLFKFFELKPFIFTSADKHETYYKAFEGMREYFMQKSRA